MNTASMVENAKTYLEKGDLNSSLNLLLSAIEDDPDHQECNSLLGGILCTQQQFELSDRFLLSAAVLSNWTDVESVISLSSSLRLRGDNELALRMISRVQSGQNDQEPSVRVCTEMAEALYGLGNYSSGAEWYLRAAIASQDDEDLWLRASTLGLLEKQRAHVDLVFAENVLRYAVALNPQSATLHFYLGRALHMTGRLEDAAAFYSTALATSDPASHTHYDAAAALATVRHEQGQYAVAEQYYRLAEQLAPSNALLLANFASLLAAMNRMEDGLRVARRAVAADSTSAEAAAAFDLFVLKLL